jgi:hypothetical protein
MGTKKKPKRKPPVVIFGKQRMWRVPITEMARKRKIN